MKFTIQIQPKSALFRDGEEVQHWSHLLLWGYRDGIETDCCILASTTTDRKSAFMKSIFELDEQIASDELARTAEKCAWMARETADIEIEYLEPTFSDLRKYCA